MPSGQASNRDPGTVISRVSLPSGVNALRRMLNESKTTSVSPGSSQRLLAEWNSPGPLPLRPMLRTKRPASSKTRTSLVPELSNASEPFESRRAATTRKSCCSSVPSAAPMVVTGSGDRLHISGALSSGAALLTTRNPAVSRSPDAIRGRSPPAHPWSSGRTASSRALMAAGRRRIIILAFPVEREIVSWRERAQGSALDLAPPRRGRAGTVSYRSTSPAMET